VPAAGSLLTRTFGMASPVSASTSPTVTQVVVVGQATLVGEPKSVAVPFAGRGDDHDRAEDVSASGRRTSGELRCGVCADTAGAPAPASSNAIPATSRDHLLPALTRCPWGSVIQNSGLPNVPPDGCTPAHRLYSGAAARDLSGGGVARNSVGIRRLSSAYSRWALSTTLADFGSQSCR
jgi:hypothetical protein